MTGSEVVWPDAHEALKEDAAFGTLIREVGPVRLRPRAPDAFRILVRSIVYQQLAGKAAATIHGRVVEALDGTVSPESVLASPEEALRGAGLSGSKLKAIRDLAEKARSGEVPLHDLEELHNEAVVERLTRVWGIGQWTADMFLLFQLRRPDVWPVGDLGVRAGWGRVHGLSEIPGAGELEPLGEPYRPWRSAVAWYCWRAVEVITPET